MTTPHTSTRERLRDARHLMFVGRRAEQGAFREYALSAGPPAYTVFAFHGIGGIGKTSLLAELELLAAAHTRHVASTTMETVHSPLDLMCAWRAALPGRCFRKFDRELRRYTGVASKLHAATESVGAGALNALENAGIVGAFVAGAVGEERLRAFLSQHLSGREATVYLDGMATLTGVFAEACNEVARSGRVFLFLDYFEAATAEVDDWLRRLVGGDISTEIVFVLAGREPLHRMNPAWLTLRAVTLERGLPLLDEDEVAEYFARNRITDPLTRDRIGALAGGLPWALALSAETAGPGGGQGPGRGDVQSMVVNRFLSQLGAESAELRHAVEAASLVAWFDEDLLRSLVSLPPDFSASSLTRYSFISIRDDGKYAVRDAVREAVATGLHRGQESRWLRTHRLAADYHARLAGEAPRFGDSWRRHFLEVVRHTLETDPAQAVARFVETVERLPVQVWAGPCGQSLLLLEGHAATGRRPRVLLASAEASLAINHLDAARERFHRVAGAAAEPWPRLRAYAGLVDIEHRAGAVREALRLSLVAHRAAEEAGSYPDAAIFAARAAEMSGSTGDEPGVDRYCAQAERHLERCDDLFARGQARLVMAYTQIFAGRYLEGGTQLARALEDWGRAHHAFGVAQVHSARAWVGWLTEQVAMGMRSARLAMEYFADSQDTYSYGLVALNLAELHRCRGDMDRAVEWNRLAAGKFAETGGVLYHSIALYRLGRAQAQSGHGRPAIASLRESIGLLETVGEAYSHGIALLHLADALISDGQRDVAPLVDRAEELLSGAQNRHGRAWAPVAVALLEHRLDPAAEVAGRLARGLELARAAGFWDIAATARTHALLIGWERGERAGAGPAAVEAVACAARHGPYCADRTLAALRALLAGLDDAEREAALRRLADFAERATPSGDPFDWDVTRRAEEGIESAAAAEALRTVLRPRRRPGPPAA